MYSKKALIYLIVLILVNACSTQTYCQPLLVKGFDTNKDDIVSGFAELSPNRLVFCGYRDFAPINNIPSCDGLIFITDAQGNIIRQLNTPHHASSNFRYLNIIIDGAHHINVIGVSGPLGIISSNSVFIAKNLTFTKLDSNLNIISQYTYPMTNMPQYPQAKTIYKDGAYFGFMSYWEDVNKSILYKLDSAGNLLQTRKIDTSFYKTLYPYASYISDIKPSWNSPNVSVIWNGTYIDTISSNDVYTPKIAIKLAPDLSILDTSVYNVGATDSTRFSVFESCQISAHNYLVGGLYQSNYNSVKSTTRLGLGIYNDADRQLKVKDWVPLVDSLDKQAKCATSQYISYKEGGAFAYMLGVSKVHYGVGIRLRVAKYDTSGSLIWERSFGEGELYTPAGIYKLYTPVGIYELSDGSLLVNALRYNQNDYNFYIFRLDNNSGFPLSTSDITTQLRQAPIVFPNPATKHLGIDMSGLNESYDISISGIDGKWVFYQQGLSEAKLNIPVENFAAGVYLYHIQTRSGKVFIGKWIKE